MPHEPEFNNAEFDLEQKKIFMRKGLLEYCVLLTIARQGEAYATDILQELKIDNLLVVEGTLYPLFSRLRGEGILEYSWRESKSGPPRKYYRLTASGKKVLETLSETWQGLLNSINSLVKKINEKNN
jgi:PadR family transcriptional regulator PadR